MQPTQKAARLHLQRYNAAEKVFINDRIFLV